MLKHKNLILWYHMDVAYMQSRAETVEKSVAVSVHD